MDLAGWEVRFRRFLVQQTGVGDAAHDVEHVRRVVANARWLAAEEGAELAVVIPAAWLHDCVTVPKDSPQRSSASRLAAARAKDHLRNAGYPEKWLQGIAHAIEAHSFSAGIPTTTLEAAVVQDADRLDALGSIGIARTLALGGEMGQPLYDPTEPIPITREPDDRRHSIDHFFVKLLTLAETMKTASGRREAERRTDRLKRFLLDLAEEAGQELPSVHPLRTR